MSFTPLAVDLVGYDPPPMFPNSYWAVIDEEFEMEPRVKSIRTSEGSYIGERKLYLRIYVSAGYSWFFGQGAKPGRS